MKEHLGAHYDRTSHFQQGCFDILRQTIREHAPGLDKIRTVLDIGSGTGARTKQSLGIFPSLEKMVGIEPDHDMIEIAQQKYSDSRIEYKKMPAEDISLLASRGDIYDGILSNWSLHWIENKDKLMEDIATVTHPDSLLMFSTSQVLPPILSMIDAYIRLELRVKADHTPFFHMRTVKWEELLERHGWEIISLVDDTLHRETPSAKEYLEQWFTSSAAKAMYGKHLFELSSLTKSDIVFMMERAFPPITIKQGVTITEDRLFVVAKRKK